MDDEQDLGPKPEPDIPNQDELPERMPAHDFEEAAPEVGELAEQRELLDDVDQAAEDLAQAGAAEEPPPALIDLPQDQPRPPDNVELPSIETPDIADEGIAPFGEELGEVDLAQQALSEPVSGEQGADGQEEALSAVDAFGRDLDQFNTDGGAGGFDQGGQGDDGQQGSEDAMRNLGESDIRNRDSVAGFLVDHARRIDEITERLERSRL